MKTENSNETMKRIKTNIIELNKLKRAPCDEWLQRFECGKIDAHDTFKKHGKQYEWLYSNSPYDLISWEIENNCFDWKTYSWIIAKCCPENFDADKYNWKGHSWAIAQYCPKNFDADRYNWERNSCAVAQYCPENFDADRYNWKDDSWAVAYIVRKN